MNAAAGPGGAVYSAKPLIFPTFIRIIRMQFFKKSKKSRQPSQHPISLGVPTQIAVGALGIGADLDVGPEGVSRTVNSRCLMIRPIWILPQAKITEVVPRLYFEISARFNVLVNQRYLLNTHRKVMLSAMTWMAERPAVSVGTPSNTIVYTKLL